MIRELPPTAGLPLRLADLTYCRTPASLSETLGLESLILTSSGAAALWTSLETLKPLRPDRRVVIVPAFTCPLVAIAVRQAGLEPRLCDTLPGHFDLDPVALREHCRDDTLAVITTHLGGRVADAAGACVIAQSVGAFLIEDAAQALGARTGNDSVGLVGDIGIFSLGAGKGLSIYAGGLAVAHDPRIRSALQKTHGQLALRRPLREALRAVQTLGLWAAYRPTGLWFAYGQPLRRALAAGDLIGALSERFAPHIIAHRVGRWREQVAARAAQRLMAFLGAGRERAKQRIAHLEGIKGISVLQDRTGDTGTWPYFLVRLPNEACRNRALESLWQAGLGVSRAFCHALPDYPELEGWFGPADVTQARDFAARTLTVTNCHWMREGEFDRILAGLETATR